MHTTLEQTFNALYKHPTGRNTVHAIYWCKAYFSDCHTVSRLIYLSFGENSGLGFERSLVSADVCATFWSTKSKRFWRIRNELLNKNLVIISVVAEIFYVDSWYTVCGVTTGTERNKSKRWQDCISLKTAHLDSAHRFLFTNTEMAGLEPGAVFATLGSFLCEVWGSTAAVGACWEAQGGCWCLRSSSWGSGRRCPPGSPSGPRSPSGPASSAGSAVPSTVAHSGSFLMLKYWWSNPAGGTSRRGSSLVYLCSFPDEFAGRTDGGCTGDRLCSALRVALVPTWTDLQREETEKDTRAIPTAREHACNYLLLLFV